MERLEKVILTVVLLICLTAAVFAGWKLYSYYRVYHDGKKEYDNLTKYIDKDGLERSKDTDQNNERDKGKDRCPISVDFASLKKINREIVGWIYIPETGIDYPIVQAKDNTKYLHRTFRGKDSYVGAIFLDALCKPDFSSFNSIIYGHNLKNGEMFGHLKKLYDVEYNPKADYKKHPTIWIITPNYAWEYRIFAFREINARKDPDVYTIDLPDIKERRAFLDKQIRRAQKDTGIKPLETERVITLSTCTSRNQEGRFIVQAIKC